MHMNFSYKEIELQIVIQKNKFKMVSTDNSLKSELFIVTSVISTSWM